ncbi:hypothetical protein KQH49_10105 [Mycetohabitans sp. B5]|nr:hypothetical protein [Mycetohabitans sp. B5]
MPREHTYTLFAAHGVPVTVIRDSTSVVAQRIVATTINIACDIARQQTATPQDIDLAVMLDLGYPKGPLALGDALGAARILTILRPICAPLHDPRYRPSPWLARRAQLGLSLLPVEGDAPQHMKEPTDDRRIARHPPGCDARAHAVQPGRTQRAAP